MVCWPLKVFWVVVCACASIGHVHGQEIGFVEEFALANDRQATLNRLVPGTDEYFYFHSLYYQSKRQFDKVDELLKTWNDKLGWTEQAKIVRYRQALLKYDDDPNAAYQFLQNELNLHFNHQREIPATEKNLPSQLNPEIISDSAFEQQARNRYSDTSGFLTTGLELINQTGLDKDRRRHLLSRLQFPDYPNIVELILADLRELDSTGFGHLQIHSQLTLEQLEECLQIMPKLLDSNRFVEIYLPKLHGSDDINLASDRQAYQEFLVRLRKFVDRLNPSFNSLKACVIYRQLELDRRQGRYDRQTLMEYLKLPRNVAYVNPQLVQRVTNNEHLVDLGSDYRQQIFLAPIHDDQSLVRDYLQHFLKDAINFDLFRPYIHEEYLKKEFATAKVLSGQGDVEQWASMLTPQEYKELVNRIDLDFAFTNDEFFEVQDTISLDMFTKNIHNLIVNVYQIESLNYYRKYLSEIDTDINLDGLVPNFEKTYRYDDEPARRVKRTFTFDQLDQPGIYVIDFIGGGISSRALVRRGRLSLVAQPSIAGLACRVFDDQQQLVSKSSMWIDGRRYDAEQDGLILVPFSQQPGSRPAIISDGKICSLQQIQLIAENYRLDAAMYVDRQSLMFNQKAKVVIRPQLSVADVPGSVQVLSDVQLTVASTNQNGIGATRRFGDLKLSDHSETVCEFVVPPRLKSIKFELTAKVKNISKGTDETLSVGNSYELNGIDTSDKVQHLHLRPDHDGYWLEVRGKNGELRPSQAVRIDFWHRHFADSIAADLQSSDDGQIRLGNCANIARIRATLVNGVEEEWSLRQAATNEIPVVHGPFGQPIRFAAPEGVTSVSREELSMFATSRNFVVSDQFERIALDGRTVELRDLTPGDYVLRFKKTDKLVRVSVTEGPLRGDVVMGKTRRLELRGSAGAVIQKIDIDEGALRVQLQNASDSARMHVFASRYASPYDPFGEFSKVRDISPWKQSVALRKTAYVAGRTLSDEYQYILNRRYQKRFVGNMLERPSLLTSRYSIRETQNEVESLAAGEGFYEAGNEADAPTSREENGWSGRQNDGDFANIDFLERPALVLENLNPDADGVVEIDLQLLAGRHHLEFVVIDQLATCVREFNLQSQPFEPRELRLKAGLDPNAHFLMAKQIELLPKGGELTIEDLIAGRFHYFDDLEDVFRLFQTLNPSAPLPQFEFLLQWSKKPAEEKQKLYSEFACHELNYYLFQKDRPFFDGVVRKHIANKLEKQFLDSYFEDIPVDQYADNPWQFARLNAFERILLSRRNAERAKDLVRNIDEMVDLSPISREFAEALFETAIRTGELARESGLAFQPKSDASEEVEQLSKDKNGLGAGGGFGGRLEGGDVPGQPLKNPAIESPGDPAGGALGARFEQGENQKLRRAARLLSDDEAPEDAPGRVSDGQVIALSIKNLRDRSEVLYRRLQATKEYIEQQYYQLPLAEQSPQRVPANRFWQDFARHREGGFFSPHFAEAHRNLTEMLLALAVLDLPEAGPEHKFDYQDDSLTLTAASPMMAVHQQLRAVPFQPGNTTILVTENFYQHNDRYRVVDGIQQDKFVSSPFYAHTLYGSQVVITNPTSLSQAIDLLVQIPRGAIACNGSQQTQSRQIQLSAFSTQIFEYFFYFPAAGQFSHFPAHVSRDEQVLAVADNIEFNVIDQPLEVDRTSWNYVSQNGSDDDVLAFLEKENVLRLDLNKIAFRMNRAEFAARAFDLLQRRCLYSHLLWSYGIRHQDVDVTNQFLQHEDRIAQHVGLHLDSPLLSVDSYSRNWYQHREYDPLVNARINQVGAVRKILNPDFYQQYHRLLDLLAMVPKLSSEHHLAVTYYMLLQDRIDEALAHFGKINPDELNEKLQYDYCAAYLDFYMEKPDLAEATAQRWAEYPVDSWRKRFQSILDQVREIRGQQVVKDADDKQQDQRAAETATFDFQIDGQKIKVTARELDQVEVNYYEMDIELMFSRSPFEQADVESFSVIAPVHRQSIDLLPDGKFMSAEFQLPAEFANKNVEVEIRAGDLVKSKRYFANSITLQLMQRFGHLQALDAANQAPIAKAYVKVYSRRGDGRVAFHKDGYTDLRGRFDYVSQSNNPLDGIEQYSILILSPDHGAITHQVAPPAE